uniref:Uncharacterized protein n=1 Tax=Lepeophtheirus salmonis TaxID=72036 RepID=A0A0K2UYX8_LEPSM
MLSNSKLANKGI